MLLLAYSSLVYNVGFGVLRFEQGVDVPLLAQYHGHRVPNFKLF